MGIRNIKITRNYIKYPEGSVLIEFGDTKVLCNASVEEYIPPFRKDTGMGWVTAEYNMLPRSTKERNRRDIDKLKQNSRAVEIQRLIGRALRSGIDFRLLGERTITIDCDVLQADGGTRTAAITGGFVAMYDACVKLIETEKISILPIQNFIAAISVGIVDGETITDLCYEEDSIAEVDMNVIMNDDGNFIEVQGTGEQGVFGREKLDELLDAATTAIVGLIQIQRNSLGKDIEYYEKITDSK